NDYGDGERSRSPDLPRPPFWSKQETRNDIRGDESAHDEHDVPAVSHTNILPRHRSILGGRLRTLAQATKTCLDLVRSRTHRNFHGLRRTNLLPPFARYQEFRRSIDHVAKPNGPLAVLGI